MLESQNELRRLAAKRLTALANQPNEGKRPETASIANIFRRPNRKKATRLEVTGRAATFTAFSGDPYANDVFRAGVDAIARLAAKFLLVPTATFSDGSRAATDDRLANLLQVEPNPYMSAYDMLYQLYTHLYIKNNAYVYVHREGGQVVGFYPLHVAGCDYQQDELGNVYCVFTFANGRTHTLPYGDVIHLRRHFNSGDVAGDPNDAIAAGVELADTQNKGIEQAIKTSGNIRGILRSTQVLGPSKLRELKDDFVKNYLSLENSGGVAAVDTSLEFTPIEPHPVTITKEDQEATKAKIYNYLGIGESIVNGTFTDEEFGAFDESTIEALSLQTSLEFTRKIYSPLQVARGRRIECSTSRLHFMNNQRKLELIKDGVPMGVLTINGALDLLGLPPMEEDRRIQSLNYISTELVDEYQLMRAGTTPIEPKEPSEPAQEDPDGDGGEDED